MSKRLAKDAWDKVRTILCQPGFVLGSVIERLRMLLTINQRV
jgi:hypothetical protein